MSFMSKLYRSSEIIRGFYDKLWQVDDIEDSEIGERIDFVILDKDKKYFNLASDDNDEEIIFGHENKLSIRSVN